MNKILMKGNDAVVFGALLGGATHFFGYPITPASEIAHTAAFYFPRAGRHFLQAESEISAINMIYGAAGAGARSMTASSGPGVSLMAEGISYLAGAELPSVIVDIQRAGPGLGNIWPEQSDYDMVVKGGGHGNYKNVVFAPNSVQEMCDFVYRAFEIADQYRMTVFILSDAYVGQMMEPVLLPAIVKHGQQNEWAIYADKSSRKNLITSILMNTTLLSEHNLKLQEKYKTIQHLVEYEDFETDDADVVYVAFGICARICFTAVQELRKKGKKIGLLRPKTLFPFPKQRLVELSKKNSTKFIVVELNQGMMADDVQLALDGTSSVLRYNWFGGVVPSITELISRTEQDYAGR